MAFLPLSKLVFVDETWIKTNMTRLCGWSPRGERLRDKAPFGHWQTLTFMGGLKADRIIAPWLLDQAIDGTSFIIWVTKCLVPALAPGDIVVMDRLSSHKMPAVRAAIRAAGAKLWLLPPYSPDLNPIEQAFSKLKTLFRKAKARTVDDACKQIGILLQALDPKECEAFIRHVGYGASA
jgi:transposase